MKKTSLMKAAMIAVTMGAAAMGVSMVVTSPAVADVASSKALVDAAKARGTVGEQNDGFLGFVSGGGDAALKAAVDEINAGRHDVFAQAAAKNGVSIEAAGASAFANAIFPKLKAGQYYQDADGHWVKK